jgi:hypothetical protein
MKVLSNFKKMYLIAGMVLVFSGFTFGQSPDAVTIKPKSGNRQLVAECRFKNLLSAEIMEGLSSGISRSLVFHFILLQDNTKKVLDVNRSIHLKYNVWEDFFLVTVSGKTHIIKTKAAFNRFLDDSLNFSLASLSALPGDKSLRLQLAMGSDDLTSAQREELDDWLRQSESDENSISDQENRTGFSINLSTLLTLFFEKERDKRQLTHTSEPFTLQSLK